MTDKLLFYIDTWFFHFGIAKALNEKSNFEMYSIIDVDDKAKKFFLNQKMVNFKQVWYYLDCFNKQNKKPNFDYLKSFEEKYNINLWSVAYTDRDFYRYNPNYKFKDNEILSIIEQECRFFDTILDNVNPDFFITYIPITHYQYLLHQICQARKIKSLILGPIRFGNKMMISEEPLKIDYLNINSKTFENVRSKEELKNYMKKYDSYQSLKEKQKTNFESNKWARYKAIMNFFVYSRPNNFGKRYSDYGKTKSRVLISKFSRSRKRKDRESFINKNFIRKIDDNTPFIYFPLHFEPERILFIDAPYYENQIAVITSIAKSIPVGYKLYVKEHPMMRTQGWRETNFYKQIMDLPNVKLIHPSVKPDEVIKKSSLVITIAGTVPQEAAFYNIPAITFTNQVYTIMPSVHKLNKIEDLPILIKTCLSKKIEDGGLNKFLDVIEKNTFELDHKGMSSEFAYKFGFKGPVMDAELPVKEIENFLKKHNSTFEMLASEHLKKMEQHKKFKSKIQVNEK